MIDEFITCFMKEINKIMTTYYEETPANATYPYAVIPHLNIVSLDYGYQCIFDVEVYVNELSGKNVEELCDKLRIGLDQLTFHNEKVAFHINDDSQNLSKQVEQDFSDRKVSFIARIF